jgi:phage head maturation protease
MEVDKEGNLERVAIYPEGVIQRYIPQKERDSYDASDFAGPERSFPITSQAQLDAAAKLIGHAADPDAVKAKAKAIAKRKGFTLPESWQEGDKKEERSGEAELHALYMPISYMSRREDDEWIVEGQATAEVPDTFGTIFTYEASKKAFQNWLSRYANVREMHGKKAAGKGISLDFDDIGKRVLVRTRVSKGAPDTWIKFQEGVLNGFSVGAGSVKMGRMNYQGKSYPAITDYELAELSYVDNPSCPGSDARIVMRADGMLEDIIDDSEPEQASSLQGVDTPEEERVGKSISSATQKSMHGAIGGVLKGAKSMMDTCGCESCTKASKMIDPDNDGDVDWMGIDDPDNDAKQLQERMQRAIAPALERSLAPVYQRHQSILARYAQFDTHYEEIRASLDELKKTQDLLNETKAILERMASATTLDEVRAELSAVKDQVTAIAKTPLPGGPIQNGARPYDKSTPYQPEVSTSSRGQVEREVLERLHANGAFRSPDDQIAAAALMLRPMQGMR